MSETEEIDSADVFRIMVSTDNHLGYCETDPIRGDDSFIAFEEMLIMAVEEDVDFILLGGDLFHDSVPSQNSLNKCMTLLRRYTFGSKAIEFEVLSDQHNVFHGSVSDSANIEDPNLNISIPVFSIHGNHDDPSSFGGFSALDLLSAAGLINYIGRCTDLQKVEVKPLLLQKGQSKMAIFGLSHIHDNRLCRLFNKGEVEIERPSQYEDEWFNLMVVHQNRAMRGHKNYLPEDVLPEFLHLVLWGHEHDCRVVPEIVPKKDYYITQPGSSVATSLAQGESLKKHVAILNVHQKKFKLEPMPLNTVRPFVFDSIDLDELKADGSLEDAVASEKVQKIAEERIQELIERAKELVTGHPKQPTLPLIRLRLVYSLEEHMFNALRFGLNYSEKVANPADVVVFKKSIKRLCKKFEDFDKDAFPKLEQENIDHDVNTQLSDLVEQYFDNTEEGKNLQILPTIFMKELNLQLIERHDTAVADNLFKNFEEKMLERLMEMLPNDEDIEEQTKRVRDSFTTDDITDLLRQNIITTKETTVEKSTAKKRKINEKEIVEEDEIIDIKEDEDDEFPIPKSKSRAAAKATTTSATTRGRQTRGRGARGSKQTRMQPLDVSVNTTATRQSPRSTKASSSSGLESFLGNSRRNKTVNYVISDDSD